MNIFPILHTNRLKLRKIQIEDIPSLVKYANNKKISDNIINIPYPYQEPDAAFRISYVVQGFKKKVRYIFAITLKERNEFIGEISLHIGNNNKTAELGFWIGEIFWGKGIATEAAGAIINFGFEKLNLDKIHATCHIENKASEKVLLNNGMKKDNINGNVIRFGLTKKT
ncbi:MAG TPA: N-acetyltransferase [Bacteroidetes bacterium]|nr:N-acetyltransferase [Bacteroidota bacterium]